MLRNDERRRQIPNEGAWMTVAPRSRLLLVDRFWVLDTPSTVDAEVPIDRVPRDSSNVVIEICSVDLLESEFDSVHLVRKVRTRIPSTRRMMFFR